MRVYKEKYSYYMFDSIIGNIVILYRNQENNIKIHRIFIGRVKRDLTQAYEYKTAPIEKVADKIERYLSKKPANFKLDSLDLSICTNFQRKVLDAVFKIPRGFVSTYKNIAYSINNPFANRAIGNVMAWNPFPIIIPCHRVIRANGLAGMYQAGMDIKIKLLMIDGVVFNNDRVLSQYIIS